jgi:hypothetical protein
MFSPLEFLFPQSHSLNRGSPKQLEKAAIAERNASSSGYLSSTYRTQPQPDTLAELRSRALQTGYEIRLVETNLPDGGLNVGNGSIVLQVLVRNS